MRDDAVLGRALPLDRGLGRAEHKHYYLYLLVPMYQCRTLRQKLILPSELSDVHIH